MIDIKAGLIVLLILSGCNVSRENSKNQTDKPNVILILADDMGVGDLAKFNGGINKTPNMDNLLTQGVYFNQAYSAAPVCAPSRAGLLTGHYPHRTGCITLNMKRFPELSRIKLEESTMANYFHENGYATGLIGKWHSGIGEDYHPMKRGFDEFEGFITGASIESYFEYTLNIMGKTQQFNDKYLTDDLTQRAINFVRAHKDEPFFLHLAHYAPHRPLSAPDSIVNQYLEQGFNKNTATIYAMIEIMDIGMGKLLEELDKLNLRKNTIVIITSDNGPDPITGERYNQDMRGTKYTIYEGGIHVPFILSWPGRIAPGFSDVLIHFTDVLPTLADLCSLTMPDGIQFDGGSFYGVLSNEDFILPEFRFWQWNRGVPYYSHNAAIRRGDWKLVRPYVTRNIPDEESTNKPQLYNIKDDPGEETDVSDRYPVEYQTLKVLLEQKCREVEHSRLNQ
jgi:arylsulfatase A-like enzyme